MRFLERWTKRHPLSERPTRSTAAPRRALRPRDAEPPLPPRRSSTTLPDGAFVLRGRRAVRVRRILPPPLDAARLHVACPATKAWDGEGDHASVARRAPARRLGLRAPLLHPRRPASARMFALPPPPLVPITAVASATSTGFTVWLTGLSGAGKTTIGHAVAAELERRGAHVELLDGDVVRTHLSKGLGFSHEDRDTNIERIGWVASRLTRHGAAVVVAAISPYDATRKRVRALVEEQGPFVEVWVKAPLEECARRDVKGLYAKALAGEISSSPVSTTRTRIPRTPRSWPTRSHSRQRSPSRSCSPSSSGSASSPSRRPRRARRAGSRARRASRRPRARRPRAARASDRGASDPPSGRGPGLSRFDESSGSTPSASATGQLPPPGRETSCS